MLSLLRLIKIYIQKNLHLRQYLITQPTRIMNNIIRLFLPKDRVFYDIFENIVANLKEMGSGLKKALHEDDPTKRTELLKVLEDGEHKNDEYTHQIFIELGKNFITPFDREDIHSLIKAIDNVADYMHGAASRMRLYQVEKITKSIRKLTEINL